jgi:hypothetical protein
MSKSVSEQIFSNSEWGVNGLIAVQVKSVNAEGPGNLPLEIRILQRLIFSR